MAELPINIIDETGQIIISRSPKNDYYLLTFKFAPDNRLTTRSIGAFMRALDVVEQNLLPENPLPLVTTSAILKFYSNGLDLEAATTVPGFWDDTLYPFFKRLLTFPTPCIALINGHAFAGGLMVAMCQDYRIMNPKRGFLCLNELDLGVGLKAPMASIFRDKVGKPQMLRKLVLESARFTATEAVTNNLVDATGELDSVSSFITERGIIRIAQSPSYGLLKRELWRNTIELCDTLNDFDEVRRDASMRLDDVRLSKRQREWASKL
ncbi:ClpP/crotonase-like domain-containing protein [Lipomyces japonicus]|uniref:ClpP/crotonase-like domain-containing protein n=1 Tax=Lipomyces japonicus TaxID=56871 RepID=UPI0034CFDD2F